jgi:CheY-like chemotaxis protein
VAPDGQQALDLLESGTEFQAVLMDLHMPVLGGLEATKALREKEASGGSARMPVIALTADAVKGDREKCLAAGMDDYLSKPLKLSELSEVLKKLC